MPEQDQQPLSHCNKYAADSACVHCEGIIRHESWCATQNISVHYAYQAIQDPNYLSLGDYFALARSRRRLGEGFRQTSGSLAWLEPTGSMSLQRRSAYAAKTSSSCCRSIGLER